MRGVDTIEDHSPVVVFRIVNRVPLNHAMAGQQLRKGQSTAGDAGVLLHGGIHILGSHGKFDILPTDFAVDVSLVFHGNDSGLMEGNVRVSRERYATEAHFQFKIRKAIERDLSGFFRQESIQWIHGDRDIDGNKNDLAAIVLDLKWLGKGGGIDIETWHGGGEELLVIGYRQKSSGYSSGERGGFVTGWVGLYEFRNILKSQDRIDVAGLV